MVCRISDVREKRTISRTVLEDLPEWFGIPEAREEYVADSADQLFFADLENGEPVGFLCLRETGKDTAEIAVMGVRRAFHGRGVGRRLFEAARREAVGREYSFLQVKTVQMGRSKVYDGTNRFYRKLGFLEFEVFPTLWDPWNPCQIYVLSLK